MGALRFSPPFEFSPPLLGLGTLGRSRREAQKSLQIGGSFSRVAGAAVCNTAMTIHCYKLRVEAKRNIEVRNGTRGFAQFQVVEPAMEIGPGHRWVELNGRGVVLHGARELSKVGVGRGAIQIGKRKPRLKPDRPVEVFDRADRLFEIAVVCAAVQVGAG